MRVLQREQIENALDFVGLTDYVVALENGIDTQVNSDTLFSQGQKQLLAIARAIVTDPPILLLDEITANLDSITEEKFISVLQKASQCSHNIIYNSPLILYDCLRHRGYFRKWHG